MPQVAPLRPDDPKRVGRYRLTGRIIGVPATSRTYLGRTTAGDRVTVTLFAGDRTPDGAARDRFTAEARAARRVAPFCAARILDTGIEADRPYLVSEYVPGPLLSEVVAAAGPREGAELEALAIGMATGLAAVHQAGLVHGEFGPEHVVLGVDGPRVTGFDITPPYGTATPAADMLAWAQTVLFAASGASPSAAALADLPEPLRGMVASCGAPEPAARPAARQVVVRLIGHDSPQAGVLAEGSRRAAKAAMRAPAEPAASAARPPSARRQRRSRAVGWSVAAAVCVLAIAVAVHVLQNASSAHATPDSANRPAASHTGSPSARPSPAGSPSPTVTIPAAESGTWSGSVQQGSGNINTDVRLGGSSSAGTITYSGTSFTCSGKLTLQSSADHILVMNQEIVAGVCLDGLVTLTQEPDGTLRFHFKGASSLAATGTLTRR
jgi:eukaryotic-like serine/threonine-protein kinase